MNMVLLENHNGPEYYNRKLFWRTEELKLKKMKMKIFNFLHKIARDCKFWSRKPPSFMIMKM